jgi:hypothetical protein
LQFQYGYGVDNPVEVTPVTFVIPPTLDARLLRVLGRGFYWLHLLSSGKFETTSEIAERDGDQQCDTTVIARTGDRRSRPCRDTTRAVSLEELPRTRMPTDWGGAKASATRPTASDSAPD